MEVNLVNKLPSTLTKNQAIAYAGKNITSQHIRDIYGIASSGELIEFILKCNNNDVAGVLKTIEDFENRGLDFTRLTSTLIDVLKEVIIYKNTSPCFFKQLIRPELSE